MGLLNIVLFWIFFGFWSSYLARKRERNPTLWFCLGIFLGIIGVIIIALLPKPTKKRPSQPIILEPVKELPKIWYLLDQERKHIGPFTSQELKELPGICASSYIWCEGMESWKRIEELPDLSTNLL